MKAIATIFFLCFLIHVTAQNQNSTVLNGQVKQESEGVARLSVFNLASQLLVLTAEDGKFAIEVNIGDELVFVAVNYQAQKIIVTAEILEENNLIVRVKVKVNELKEVVVKAKKGEVMKIEGPNDYSHNEDRPIVNNAVSLQEQGMVNGMDFVAIYRMIFKKKKKKEKAPEQLLASDVLRTQYETEFFTQDLQIPKDKVDEFILFCDDKIVGNKLFKKENEFILIDLLVKQSKNYLKLLNAEK